MIARINGTVEAVGEESALVAVGEISYEVLVPAVDIPHLQTQVGRRVAFYTLEYIEGNASFGQLSPRLLGFLRRQDKEFFERFITVKGIGPRRALRVLVAPVAEIAAAVNRKDVGYLTGLPEIGKRTAEHMIAELSGKVDEFAGPGGPSMVVERSAEQLQAIAALVTLGEKRPEVENWVDRACRADPALVNSQEIMRAVYRLKAGG
jgi:holliday junction DNA helicase RuvA